MAPILFFQNEAKNNPRQGFIMINISREFEISTYNTLCSRGPTKLLAKSRKKMPVATMLFFKMRPKNIPRQDFMVMNISCKCEKSSYNIFFVRAVMVKSLYTLRRRHNKAKSIVSTGCYPVDTISNSFEKNLSFQTFFNNHFSTSNIKSYIVHNEWINRQ